MGWPAAAAIAKPAGLYRPGGAARAEHRPRLAAGGYIDRPARAQLPCAGGPQAGHGRILSILGRVDARSHSGSGLFVTVAEGLSVARKRIVLLNSTMEGVTRLRFQVTAAAEWPVPMVEVAAFAPCGKP